jgi:hypothetical protein
MVTLRSKIGALFRAGFNQIASKAYYTLINIYRIKCIKRYTHISESSEIFCKCPIVNNFNAGSV